MRDPREKIKELIDIIKLGAALQNEYPFFPDKDAIPMEGGHIKLTLSQGRTLNEYRSGGLALIRTLKEGGVDFEMDSSYHEKTTTLTFPSKGSRLDKALDATIAKGREYLGQEATKAIRNALIDTKERAALVAAVHDALDALAKEWGVEKQVKALRSKGSGRERR